MERWEVTKYVWSKLSFHMKKFINCLWPSTLQTSLTYKPFQYLMVCIYMQASGVIVMYDISCVVLSF